MSEKMISRIDEHLMTVTVMDIFWERVTVFIDVLVKTEQPLTGEVLQFYAVNGAYQAKAEFTKKKRSDSIYRLSLNVTNPGTCRCLPIGNYSLVACSENEVFAIAEVDRRLVPMLADKSRSFLHGGIRRMNVYAVDFLLKEYDENLPFLIHVLYAKKSGMGDIYTPKAKKKLIKRIPLKRRAFKCLQILYDFHRKVRPKSQNPVILFLYEENYNIESNLKTVKNRLVERGLDKEYRIFEEAWLYLKNARRNWRKLVPAYYRLIKKLAAADLVFVDNAVPLLDKIKVDKTTAVINLWHAGAGFKAVGYSRWGHLAAPAPYIGHRIYKYGAAGSRYIAEFFAEAWGINVENILPTGMPRLDKYLNKEYRCEKTLELLEKYPCARDKKVILFAPTFRGKNRAEAHYPYEIIDFEKLYELCGDEYVVFFKMHPWISESFTFPESMSDKFFDLSAYTKINDLFYITELLITDYSSCIYEFSLMHKPMLFFAFDEFEYAVSRGFHRDYASCAPGKICHTFAELLEAIESGDFEIEKANDYIDKSFDIIDTNSSDRVIDWFILGKMPAEFQNQINERERAVNHLAEIDFSSLKKSRKKEQSENNEQQASI